MIVIGVDPGVRCSGVAVLVVDQVDKAVLETRAGLARIRDDIEFPDCALRMAKKIREICLDLTNALVTPVPNDLNATIAIEFPQVYRRSKGDPNDLVHVGAVIGALVAGAKLGSCETYLPRRWKGTVDPDVMTQRILEKFPSAIWHDSVIGSLRHNAVDAIGIAYFHATQLCGLKPTIL